MSRVGKAPIPIPSGVTVSVDDRNVTVKGSKGELSRLLPEQIDAAVEDDQVVVTRTSDERQSRALHGLMRALIANMVVGVSEGYRKQLEIVGVGYRANMKGQSLELQVGFSHPVLVDAPDGVTIDAPDQTTVVVTGIDKELVGQVTANIRKIKPPLPL